MTIPDLPNVAPRGRTIRLYLVDGAPTGTLTAEIMNWTGRVLVSPRSQLAEIAKRPEVRRTGVYCLVGRNPESPGQDCVYVGESDNVLSRLVLHDKDEAKDFWTRTVIVTSKDENLTKSHVRFIESRLIRIGHEAGRAVLTNGTAPPPPALPEADVADMEFFLSQIRMVLPVLGFGFLQPKPTVRPSESSEVQSPLFVLESTKLGVRAEARDMGDEFVIAKGSTSRKGGVDSWTSGRGVRDQLVVDGKLVDGAVDGLLVFAEDVAFSSPSTAASVVLGANTNGRAAWRESGSGKTYAEWQELQLKLAGVSNSDD